MLKVLSLGFVFKSIRLSMNKREKQKAKIKRLSCFQMFLRPLFLRLTVVSLSKRIFPIRSITFKEPIKRKILSRINTVLNETKSSETANSDGESGTVACLNNELILSARTVKFPFHYRCLLEQQLGICSDRSVSNAEWIDLYEIVGQSTKPVFASITMLVCDQLKHVQRGKSLFHFIEQTHPDLLISTPTTPMIYMNLLGQNFFSITGKKHREDFSTNQNELIRVYQNYVQKRKQVSEKVRIPFSSFLIQI